MAESEETAWSDGEAVVYHDSRNRPHPALITAWWGDRDGTPSVNLVYVDNTPGAQDSYGQQLVRETSVVHRDHQGAPGEYWRRPDEDPVTA